MAYKWGLLATYSKLLESVHAPNIILTSGMTLGCWDKIYVCVQGILSTKTCKHISLWHCGFVNGFFSIMSPSKIWGFATIHVSTGGCWSVMFVEDFWCLPFLARWGTRYSIVSPSIFWYPKPGTSRPILSTPREATATPDDRLRSPGSNEVYLRDFGWLEGCNSGVSNFSGETVEKHSCSPTGKYRWTHGGCFAALKSVYRVFESKWLIWRC